MSDEAKLHSPQVAAPPRPENVRPFRVVSEHQISQVEFEAALGALHWIRVAIEDLERRFREMRFGKGVWDDGSR
jgi:hypothetical protein